MISHYSETWSSSVISVTILWKHPESDPLGTINVPSKPVPGFNVKGEGNKTGTKSETPAPPGRWSLPTPSLQTLQSQSSWFWISKWQRTRERPGLWDGEVQKGPLSPGEAKLLTAVGAAESRGTREWETGPTGLLRWGSTEPCTDCTES